MGVNIVELLEITERLVILLRNPSPGAAMWHEAVGDQLRALPRPPVKINQALVNRIVERARASEYGLGAPERGPGAYDMSQYAPKNLDMLAVLLISAHHAKWDLISIVAAALEEVAEQQI